MFCPECGTEVISEAKFCMKCGRQLPTEYFKEVTRKSTPDLQQSSVQMLCDICSKDLCADDAKMVSSAEMRIIAGNGYGRNVILWGGMSAEEKHRKFYQLTLVNDTTWALCPSCYQDTRSYAIGSVDGPSHEDFRKIAIKPLLEAVESREATTKEIAAQQACIISQPQKKGWKKFSRFLLATLGFTLLAIAISYLKSSYHTIILPRLSIILGGSMFETFLDPRNGVNLSIGLSLGMLSILALNSALRGKGEVGPIDWLVKLGFQYRAIPLLLLLVSIGWFLKGFFVDTVYYHDPEKAAEAFTEVGPLDLSSTENILFGIDEKNRAHVAKITPSLVRALRNRSLTIYPQAPNRHEAPVPGILPILFLLFIYVGWFVTSSRQQFRYFSKSVILPFGLINFYTMWWCASGNRGIFFEKNTLHPEWVFESIVITVCFLTFLWIITSKLKNSELSVAIRSGWISVFFLINLGAMAGIQWVSYSSAGNPIFLWLSAYLVAGSVSWLVSLTVSRKAVVL